MFVNITYWLRPICKSVIEYHVLVEAKLQRSQLCGAVKCWLRLIYSLREDITYCLWQIWDFVRKYNVLVEATLQLCITK